MNKIENLSQIHKIAAKDIIVKYPLDGKPIESFAGRNLENSIAYEVENKNETAQVINFIIPDSESKTKAGSDTALHKTFTDLIKEKVWWIAKY